MSPILQVIPFLTLVVWLGLIIYLVALLSRLVRATEEIAAVLSARMPRTRGE